MDPSNSWMQLVNSIEAYQSSCAAGQPDISSFQQCQALLQDLWAANQQATKWKRLIRVEQVCNGLTRLITGTRRIVVVFCTFLVCMPCPVANVCANHVMYPLEVHLCFRKEDWWQMQHNLLRVAYDHVCCTICTQSQQQPCCCCCCLFTTVLVVTVTHCHHPLLLPCCPRFLCASALRAAQLLCSTVAAMSRLLVAALNALYQGAVRDGALTVVAKPSDLATSVAKQLQQGKLVESLPTISEAAAADLSVLPAPTEIAEQLLDPGYELSGSSDCQPLLLDSSSLQAAQRHAAQLLDVLNSFKHLWTVRQYADIIAPLRHISAMEVASALIRSISYCLEHLQPTLLQPPRFLNDLLERAFLIAGTAAEEWHAHAAGRDCPPYSLLLWSRYCLPCLAISIMVMSYATLLQEEQQAAHADDARIRDAWQLANSQQDVLPVSHDELLALLGCSSKTVIFAAALLRLDAKQRLAAMTMTVQMFCKALMETPKPNPDRQPNPEALPQQTCYAIGFLLPTVLLHWATQYPSHRLMYDYVCSCASDGSNSGWLLLQQHQQLAMAELQEDEPADDSTGHTSGASQQQQQQQQQHLPVLLLGPQQQWRPVSSRFCQLTRTLPLAWLTGWHRCIHWQCQSRLILRSSCSRLCCYSSSTSAAAAAAVAAAAAAVAAQESSSVRSSAGPLNQPCTPLPQLMSASALLWLLRWPLDGQMPCSGSWLSPPGSSTEARCGQLWRATCAGRPGAVLLMTARLWVL